MGPLVGGAEAGGADVRVNLRGYEAFVTEQLLDAADVGTAVEQMRRKRVAECVRCGPQVEAGQFQILKQQPGDAAGGKSAAEAVGEDGRGTGARRAARLADDSNSKPTGWGLGGDTAHC